MMDDDLRRWVEDQIDRLDRDLRFAPPEMWRETIARRLREVVERVADDGTAE